MLAPLDINWIAVLVATVASMAIGSVWYLPPLFGNKWGAAVKLDWKMIKPADRNRGMMMAVLLSFIAAGAMAMLVDWSGAASVGEGIMIGLVVGLGVAMTVSTVHVVFAQQPFELALIYSGHHVLEYVVMGAILGYWQ